MEAGNAAARVEGYPGRSGPPCGFHQAAGGIQRPGDSQYDAAAASFHAGRFRSGARARMAGARSFQAHRVAGAGCRRGNRQRAARRADTCIYRVVQEALHNCARHSKARRVNVEVRREDSACLFWWKTTVKVSMRGASVVWASSGMEERVHHLGGEFRVNSRPGAGTQIEVELPLVARKSKGICNGYIRAFFWLTITP